MGGGYELTDGFPGFGAAARGHQISGLSGRPEGSTSHPGVHQTRGQALLGQFLDHSFKLKPLAVGLLKPGF